MNTLRSDQDRVVITGMGAITPRAFCIADLLTSLQQGTSAISKWLSQDTRILSKIGGDLSDFNVTEYIDRFNAIYPQEYLSKLKKLLKVTPFSGKVTVFAALEAFISAGLHNVNFNPLRFGHIQAGHNINLNYSYQNIVQFCAEPDFIDGLYGMVALDTDILATISDLLNLRGTNFQVGGACASGNIGLVTALDIIRSDRADLVLVTGPVADLDSPTLQGLALLQSISMKSFNDEPHRASRPFDGLREGFVPAHGAGCVILERYTHAKKRGANILAELCGGAITSDASRSTHPNKDGQVRSMSLAVQDAKIDKNQISYVSAHATSSIIGDITEVAAIKEFFGARAYKLKVNASKSILGHCIYSAGIIQLISTILQMKNGFVHPTLNQEFKDEKMDLDFVPNHSQEYQFDYGLSNAFGFGGLNSTVIIGRINK